MEPHGEGYWQKRNSNGENQRVCPYILKNEGSTSYLNHVLQVLFMTKDFRDALERYCSEDPATIDCELKGLFEDLVKKESCADHVRHKLGIENVNEHHDAAEYFEKILNMTSTRASQIFQGRLTHRTKCSACSSVKEAHGPFWSLPLSMKDLDKNINSVMSSIEAFFKTFKLMGENQIYCENCDAKKDATVECEMKHHPEVLTLLLQTFEFDQYHLKYVKINCKVDVPMTLEIQNITYELYSVIDHFGELKQGHYTAKIKFPENGSWYNFCDSHVIPSNPDEFIHHGVFHSQQAFLLFYKKTKRTQMIQSNPEARIPQSCESSSLKRKAKMIEAETEKKMKARKLDGLQGCEVQDKKMDDLDGGSINEDPEKVQEDTVPGELVSPGHNDNTFIKDDRETLSEGLQDCQGPNQNMKEEDVDGGKIAEDAKKFKEDPGFGESVSLRQHGDVRHYNGLLNQGSTCYLNSVLQVLFMTQDFRDAVKRHCSEDPAMIDHQLKRLFENLLREKSRTCDITRKLGIKNVGEQRDAAEYIEKILNMTSSKASEIFQGHLTHRTICSGCPNVNEAHCPFWSLPLAIKDLFENVPSVMSGIKAFFQTYELTGENQMYCEHCRAKKDAAVECRIQHHPEVLTLLLKRFEFDYYSMDYVKINYRVDIPLTLEITNVSYELYAMVEHVGQLKSGHYTAKIRSDEDGRWYNFNDSYVDLSDPLQGVCNGRFPSNTAYLLFYRKSKMRATDTLSKEDRDTLPEGLQDGPLENQEMENEDRDEGMIVKDTDKAKEDTGSGASFSPGGHNDGSQIHMGSNTEAKILLPQSNISMKGSSQDTDGTGEPGPKKKEKENKELEGLHNANGEERDIEALNRNGEEGNTAIKLTELGRDDRKNEVKMFGEETNLSAQTGLGQDCHKVDSYQHEHRSVEDLTTVKRELNRKIAVEGNNTEESVLEKTKYVVFHTERETMDDKEVPPENVTGTAAVHQTPERKNLLTLYDLSRGLNNCDSQKVQEKRTKTMKLTKYDLCKNYERIGKIKKDDRIEMENDIISGLERLQIGKEVKESELKGTSDQDKEEKTKAHVKVDQKPAGQMVGSYTDDRDIDQTHSCETERQGCQPIQHQTVPGLPRMKPQRPKS